MQHQVPLAAEMSTAERRWARHAHPFALWTRVPLVALFALVVYFRDVLDLWAFALLGALAAWAVVNPRIFPAPRSTRNWASRTALGERVWLNRRRVVIPRHQERWALALSFASALCLLPLAVGLAVRDPWATAFGVLGVTVFRLWFLDRMAWLYEEMRPGHPEYAAWDY